MQFFNPFLAYFFIYILQKNLSLIHIFRISYKSKQLLFKLYIQVCHAEDNYVYYRSLPYNIPIIYLLFKYSYSSFEKNFFAYIVIQAVVFLPNRVDIYVKETLFKYLIIYFSSIKLFAVSKKPQMKRSSARHAPTPFCGRTPLLGREM